MYEKEQMKHRCTTHSGIVHPTKGDEYILLKNERMKLLIPYTILESLFTIQGRPIIISHTCQPSRNGRDSPGFLCLVPVVSHLRQNNNNVLEFTLT